MAKVKIIDSLFQEIQKKFKGESHKIIDLMESLEKNPKKGKLLGSVGGILIKEIKYKSFRFYFVTDGYKLRCIGKEYLTDLLIKFVRMSDKKHQQQTINEIKSILINLGFEGF
ncbi:MAG: hypothetical protein ABIH37_02920 [archaeon]